MKSAESTTPAKPVQRVIPLRRVHGRRREELAFLPAAPEIVELGMFVALMLGSGRLAYVLRAYDGS